MQLVSVVCYCRTSNVCVRACVCCRGTWRQTDHQSRSVSQDKISCEETHKPSPAKNVTRVKYANSMILWLLFVFYELTGLLHWNETTHVFTWSEETLQLLRRCTDSLQTSVVMLRRTEWRQNMSFFVVVFHKSFGTCWENWRSTWEIFPASQKTNCFLKYFSTCLHFASSSRFVSNLLDVIVASLMLRRHPAL